MKTKTLLLFAAFLCCCLGAKSQNPFKDLTKNDPSSDVTFKGQSPTITDFLTSYLSETEDELHGSLAQEWRKYLQDGKTSKGVTFTVDQKNGFIHYDEDQDVAYPEDPSGYKSYVEFCYWNCDDGKHKLFAENVGLTQNGKPILAQFEGLYIYAYDNATKKLYMIDQELLGLTDDLHDTSNGVITFALPRKGKDIDVFINADSGVIQKKLTWNGKGFKLSK